MSKREVKNPLKELLLSGQTEKCWELLGPVFQHPSVHAIAARYDCSFEDIQTDVFLNLVRCQPKNPITNLGGWLFQNTKGYVRRHATKLLNQRIQQLEIENE